TRFWPISRRRTPKHLLNVLGENSLLQETFYRLEGIVPPERIVVVTNRQQKAQICDHLPRLSEENLILEPSPKNTAPCIALAAFHILRRDPEAVLVILPSDHLIVGKEKFQEAVKLAAEVAQTYDGLVTFGITPNRPETGYGYIQIEKRPSSVSLPLGVYPVKTFAEKPNLETAKRFLEAGDFYWNSGIFVWTVKKFLKELEEHQPEIHHHLQSAFRHQEKASLQRALISRWGRIRPISVDYGIMEMTRSPIFMVKGEFQWDDLGSWDAIYRLKATREGENVLEGNVIAYQSHSSLVYSQNHLVALVGMEGVLVVHTPDATLVCTLNRAQEIKQIVERLQRENRHRHL
ncbi:MAG: mannose-1-phosphate guanylyltransferase, partial [bacterium]